jgi:hypothetical protein
MPKFRVKRHAVTQPLDKPYRLIPLTQGQNAIVDVEDFDWLSRFNWYAWYSPYTKSFYAIRTTKYRGNVVRSRMHRIILNCSRREDGDHANHDTLDNRRQNLRKASRSQNISNSRMRHDSQSGFKGVCWDKAAQKWRAVIMKNWKQISLGYFSEREDAARAYDKAARKLHGDFAYLNFPTA